MELTQTDKNALRDILPVIDVHPSYEQAPCGCWVGRCDKLPVTSHARTRDDSEAQMQYAIGMTLFLSIVGTKAPAHVTQGEPMCPIVHPHGVIVRFHDPSRANRSTVGAA